MLVRLMFADIVWLPESTNARSSSPTRIRPHTPNATPRKLTFGRRAALSWQAGARFLQCDSPDRTFTPGQGNNMHIFPAIGLAVYATRAKRVTDEMFVAAAHAVAEEVIKAELDLGLILSAPVGDTEDGVCTLRSAWRK